MFLLKGLTIAGDYETIPLLSRGQLKGGRDDSNFGNLIICVHRFIRQLGYGTTLI